MAHIIACMVKAAKGGGGGKRRGGPPVRLTSIEDTSYPRTVPGRRMMRGKPLMADGIDDFIADMNRNGVDHVESAKVVAKWLESHGYPAYYENVRGRLKTLGLLGRKDWAGTKRVWRTPALAQLDGERDVNDPLPQASNVVRMHAPTAVEPVYLVVPQGDENPLALEIKRALLKGASVAYQELLPILRRRSEELK